LRALQQQKLKIRTALGNGKDCWALVQKKKDIKGSQKKKNSLLLSLVAKRVIGKSSKPLKTLNKNALS
jgi:hypothetical protein